VKELKKFARNIEKIQKEDEFMKGILPSPSRSLMNWQR
jgi:hypothetical protein